MWYYSNIVKSGKDTTWKRIEFTFINDRCMNIAFSN
jgi:competence transcription factor ComK